MCPECKNEEISIEANFCGMCASDLRAFIKPCPSCGNPIQTLALTANPEWRACPKCGAIVTSLLVEKTQQVP
jgi:hypothetical protein